MDEEIETSDDEDIANRGWEMTQSPIKDDLLPLLECPVCFDLPLPPIKTCCRGHIICVDCCSRLTRCPLCQQDIGVGRNFFAEEFLSKSMFRCKYFQDGCRVELHGSLMKNHVQICQFRPLKCQECGQKVAYAEIEGHLGQQHNIGMWDLAEDGTRIVDMAKSRNIYRRRVAEEHVRNTFSIHWWIAIFLLLAVEAFVISDGASSLLEWFEYIKDNVNKLQVTDSKFINYLLQSLREITTEK